ncbi:MAG: adenine phosphoribosyltransferase [Clostridiaceae bacterium]|jgi:adenine phosphoribosyltransferase|nr:adenine phosphoribosyltransferase [Clostridiaceae bacterium]
MDLKAKLRHVADFPKAGIDFIDITTVLQDHNALRQSIEEMMRLTREMGEFDLIVGPESRGFIFGTPLAYALDKGFVPIRKSGKLPYKTKRIEYELEYGTDVLEIHEDAIKPGQRVVVVDDLLATGGTIQSNIRLVEKLGGIVAGLVFFIELSELNGRSKLEGYKVSTVVKI